MRVVCRFVPVDVLGFLVAAAGEDFLDEVGVRGLVQPEDDTLRRVLTGVELLEYVGTVYHRDLLVPVMIFGK